MPHVVLHEREQDWEDANKFFALVALVGHQVTFVILGNAISYSLACHCQKSHF